MIPEASLSQHVAIVGKSGSGKTAAAKHLVERLIDEGRQVCVLDPGGDWWGLRASADGKSAGLPVAVLGGPQADVPVEPTSGAEVAAFVVEDRVPCVIDVSEWLKAEQIRFAQKFVETIYRLKRQQPQALHLVLEEADQFAPQKPQGEGTVLLNRISTLVRLGRKRGFRILMISQRPAILHKDVLTQANTLIAMRLVAKQDKDAVDGWIRDNADPDELRRIRGSLARLNAGEGWIYAPEANVLERYQFPMFRTFDAGATPEYGDQLVMPEVLAEIDFEALSSRFAPSVEDPEPELSEKLAHSNGGAVVAELEREYAKVVHRMEEAVDRSRELQEQLSRLDQDNRHLRRVIDQAVRSLTTAAGENANRGDALTTDERLALAAPPPAAEPRPPRERAAAEPSGLSAGARKLLDGFGALAPRAVTARQAAVCVGQSVRSSQFRPNVKALEDGNYITPAGEGRYELTGLGRAVTGNGAVPPTLETWCSRFPPSTANMLRVLVNQYPRWLDREEIARLAEVSPTSSGLGQGLRELKVNELITQHGNRFQALIHPEAF